MDIFYFQKNTTHLYGKGYHPKLLSDVFPLTSRPFQGRLVPGPHNPRRVLATSLAVDFAHGPTGNFEAEYQCRGPDYNYVKETGIPKNVVPEVPCSQLFHLHPFVRHIRGEGGAYCKEELVFRGEVLSVFYRSSEGIPAC